jgi:hypothetical protein
MLAAALPMAGRSGGRACLEEIEGNEEYPRRYPA